MKFEDGVTLSLLVAPPDGDMAKREAARTPSVAMVCGACVRMCCLRGALLVRTHGSPLFFFNRRTDPRGRDGGGTNVGRLF